MRCLGLSQCWRMVERGADLVLKEALRFDTDPMLTGGTVDGDWQRTATSDEEAVGGNLAMPDMARDRHYWHMERRAAWEEYP